jgi:chromosome segregation ATPase
VSQEKSQMPVSRQIRYFKRSRENWKQNAAQKQQKIREYEQTIRSLKISRDNWKTRAKESEKRVKELEKRLEKREQTTSKISEVSPKEISIEDLTKVPGHHYAVQTIQVSIQMEKFWGLK